MENSSGLHFPFAFICRDLPLIANKAVLEKCSETVTEVKHYKRNNPRLDVSSLKVTQIKYDPQQPVRPRLSSPSPEEREIAKEEPGRWKIVVEEKPRLESSQSSHCARLGLDVCLLP